MTDKAHELVERWRKEAVRLDSVANDRESQGEVSDWQQGEATAFTTCADELSAALAAGGQAVAWRCTQCGDLFPEEPPEGRHHGIGRDEHGEQEPVPCGLCQPLYTLPPSAEAYIAKLEAALHPGPMPDDCRIVRVASGWHPSTNGNDEARWCGKANLYESITGKRVDATKEQGR